MVTETLYPKKYIDRLTVTVEGNMNGKGSRNSVTQLPRLT